MTIATMLLERDIDYDGSQLSSLFAYHAANVQGDSVVAFHGACQVTQDTMVDVEDLRAGSTIASPRMLHFIAEQFGESLPAMILRQRLFGRLAADLIREQAGVSVGVSGDDLFIDQRKVSISVATVSPLSALFHFALNIDTEGVSVPAIGLRELGIESQRFATELLDRYRAEDDDIRSAVAKVRWVR